MPERDNAPVTLRRTLRTSPNGRFSGLPLGRLPDSNVRLHDDEINGVDEDISERKPTSLIVERPLTRVYPQKSHLSTGIVHMGVFTSF